MTGGAARYRRSIVGYRIARSAIEPVLFSTTQTSLLSPFAIARSGCPSSSKSSVASPSGPQTAGKPIRGPKVPSPLFLKTLTVSVSILATTTSGTDIPRQIGKQTRRAAAVDRNRAQRHKAAQTVVVEEATPSSPAHWRSPDQVPILIEITSGDRHRTGTCRETLGGCEAAGRIGQEHRDIVRKRVCGCEVEAPVAIEIRSRNSGRTAARGQGQRRRKTSRSISLEDGGRVPVVIRGGDIQAAIQVEIAGNERAWTGAGRWP